MALLAGPSRLTSHPGKVTLALLIPNSYELKRKGDHGHKIVTCKCNTNIS